MKFLSTLVSLFFFGSIALALLLFIVLRYYSIGLPDYRQLENYQPPVTTRLYAEDGSLLAEYATQKRMFVPEEKIPLLLKQAFIAAEDKHFYQHAGIDFLGLTRAILTNIQNIGRNRRAVGASTITQQVAKNFFLTPERSISRKIKEALLARRIENTFSKEHILELYLNEIYLGQGAYGVASASKIYFNKAMNELTLDEMAFLAALPKAPNNYHPIKKAEAAKARRDWVLGRMLEDNYITSEQFMEAVAQPVHMASVTITPLKEGQYYAEEVRRFVVDKYGEDSINLGGLSIRTSVDPALQKAATKALQDGLISYDRRHGWRGPISHVAEGEDPIEKLKSYSSHYTPKDWQYALVIGLDEEKAEILLLDGTKGIIPLTEMTWAKKALEEGRISKEKVEKPDNVLSVNDIILASPKGNIYALQQMPQVEGALVALNPHTGRVLAMAGGFAFEKNQFNRAIQANRQPGSSFKPFVYLAALDSGYTPSSLILDAPLVMEKLDGSKWKPQNYSRQFYGPTTLRVGIEKSRNLMTVRLAQAIGMSKILKYGKKFGISDKLEPNLATALGAGETTLMRLATAYGMLVNGGKEIKPTLIDRIQDRFGKTLYKHDTRECLNCSGDEATPDVKPEIPDEREQIQDPASSYQMVNILNGVVERGTGRSAKAVKKTLGAKSGTSNDSNDAWFIGFSPDLVAGVWVGFDTPQTLGPNDTGGVVAAPIFRDFMTEALKNTPDIPFRVPDSVRLVRVNATTGKPAKTGDTNVIMEAFRLDTDLTKETKIIGKDITIPAEEEDIPDMGGLY
ncbi:MAG: penicillin-binding protein 1A [Alphaproteobacteria bacterium]|nr:penicillin-binding protein 1A [Alphaproteobacteria bacterium]